MTTTYVVQPPKTDTILTDRVEALEQFANTMSSTTNSAMISSLQANNVAMRNRIVNLELRETNAEANISSVRSSLNNTQALSSNNRVKITSIQANVAVLTSYMATSVSNFSQLFANNATVTTSVHTLYLKVSNTINRVALLETKTTSIQNNLSSLTANVNAMTSRVSTSEINIATLTTRANQAAANIASLQTSVSSINSSITSINAAIAALQGNNIGTYIVDTLPVASASYINKYARVTDLFGEKTDLVLCSMVGSTYFWQPVRPIYSKTMSVASSNIILYPLKSASVVFLIGSIGANITRSITLDETNVWPGCTREIAFDGSLGLNANLAINGSNLSGITSLIGSRKRFFYELGTGWKQF